ncbi:MAG: hypothetical protein KDC52_18345, partial [Ignavibacteriae bacterium]|nr:hypothetical protein [Ignavibacteriota bacterium]
MIILNYCKDSIKCFFNFVLVFFLYSITICGQTQNIISNEQLIPIDSIRIIGNEITEDFVILRELNFSVGDQISQPQIDYNQERIFSLGLFNKVELRILEENNLSILEIDVFESWYIYPLPYLKLRDDRLSRASYGIILLYKNFRGRNETITGLATFGYDPSYSVSYYNPVLVNGENITFGFR